MKPTSHGRWTLFLYALERRHWVFRWMTQCIRSFDSYRRYSWKPTVVEVQPAPQLEPERKEEDLPPPGVPDRPKHVPQGKELIDEVSLVLYGVRNPSKKLLNVTLSINYQDGSKDSWTCTKQCGVFIEDSGSRIMLTSLED